MPALGSVFMMGYYWAFGLLQCASAGRSNLDQLNRTPGRGAPAGRLGATSLPGLGSLALCLALVLCTAPANATVFLVTNSGASGAGSLQQALLDANANPGLDTIQFLIPGAGVQTISPTTALPAITGPVILDGTTQSGYAGTPLIELNGISAGASSDGLRVTASGCVIRGLAVNRFGGAGIHLQAPGSSNSIFGNFIGTDPTGTLNRGNGYGGALAGGLWIDGSSGNVVGGIYASNRNVCSANTGAGIYLQSCSGNSIQGNLVGTTLSGAAALANTANGISAYNSSLNQIGGTNVVARNQVSGNTGSGIVLSGGSCNSNLVQGNYLGTDATGAAALPNSLDGLTVQNGRGNTVSGNLVSGNTQGGISIKSAGADYNVVAGNLVGVNAAGTGALPNGYSGITISGCHSNLVGGTAAAARNVISGNKLAGIFITSGAIGNVVQGCYIGLDVNGTTALGNKTNGVSIVSSTGNVVGGTVAGARNFIAGNSQFGVELIPGSAGSNIIQGNYVGLSVTGASALGNERAGIHVQSSGNTVGGIAAGAGNVISGNGQEGIFLDGGTNNTVQGNYIGTTAAGTEAVRNSVAGVGISGAPGNLIGGTAAGAGNLISGNGVSGKNGGMYLIGNGSTGNIIQGNRIGTDITGTLSVSNYYEGIYVIRAPGNTIGGAVAGAGNLISGNRTRGIYITNSLGTVIQGNLIGTKIDGVSDLGNGQHSVEFEIGASSTIVGGAGLAANTIAFTKSASAGAGVRIRDGSTNNLISHNSIFSNANLGIDLGTVGTNAIVACGTAGANMAQNYPVLTRAVTGNGTGIKGTLTSCPGKTYTLEFFANATADPSGCGEGQVYLGQQMVTTGGGGSVAFVASLPALVPAGYVVTATATDPANNTSEFAACIPVGAVPALTATAVAGSQLQLAWTNTAAGFVLKQTSDLNPPVTWTTVTNVPVVVAGQLTVVVPTDAERRFYLLKFE